MSYYFVDEGQREREFGIVHLFIYIHLVAKSKSKFEEYLCYTIIVSIGTRNKVVLFLKRSELESGNTKEKYTMLVNEAKNVILVWHNFIDYSHDNISNM